MSLATGTRLGVYEIVGLLGAGGMGEVYRARDTKLQRDVALKILPELFAADPDRRARFTREAHVLASLNHPNIATIHGVEESDGVTALVLELVEGPTLAEKLKSEVSSLKSQATPLSIDEALRIASQIADALDAAHEKGVVHRDLKPANIKLTADDRVKVLDFGLAKALADDSPPDASMSPTLTAMASKLGVIVGTAAYMSPEQAKGKPVDKRTDIWAFGCVLYEMLTGQRAFAGDDVTDFIVSVMTKEPDWSLLPVSTPPRTTIDLPANAQLALGTQTPLEGFDSPAVALSPDGRRLVYVGQNASGTMLFQRDLAGATIAPIAGTEGAIYAFFSPDSRWLGFLTNDKMKKTSVDGGAPVTLCEATAPLSASWMLNDTIYFGEDEGTRVSRVSAAGGRVEVVIPVREGARTVFSQALPDGRAVFMTAWGQGIGADYADVLLISVADGAAKVILHSAYDARYIEPGYVIFGRSGNVFAVRFDPARHEIVGDPVLVATGMESLFGQVHVSASASGLMAYASGGDRAVGRLAWVDRQGATEYLPAPPALYGVVDLAADGSRVAVHVADVTDYIWVYDFKRAEGRKLPAGEHNGWPVWSPDGATIAFLKWKNSSEKALGLRNVDGGGTAREIVQQRSNGYSAPSSWSPDGRVLALDGWLIDGKVGFLRLAGSKVDVLSDDRGWGAYFSPDGQYVAVTATKGRSEIVVQSFPEGRTIRQISVDGGIEPLWCRCGELFYRNGNRWMSSKIRTTPDLQWDPPQLAFQTDFIDTPGRSYAVSPDGKRLLVVKRAEPDVRDRINLVANWTEALKRVP